MFVARRHPTLRFSLLLLEEKEYYIRDFVANCRWPQNVGGNVLGLPHVSGQLRLCSRSIFFDPDDVRIPIIRLPFANVEGLEGDGHSGFTISSNSWTTMKKNAEDAPYTFTKGLSACWQFSLTYASLGEFMSLAQHMLVASRMQSTAEQEIMLQDFLHKRESSSKFHLGHIRSVSIESSVEVFNVAALIISPLVREPVHFVVTAQRLYVQPVHTVGGFSAVKSHPLSAIAAIARRRSTLKDVGLEIFFLEEVEDSLPLPQAHTHPTVGPQWDTPSGFFAFRTREDREAALQAITKQNSFAAALPGGRDIAEASASILEAGGGWLPRVTAAWQRGLLSNFDYLLYCNLAAGRSFNDLTQYPVFPWVLSDYVSSELRLDDPGVYRDLSKPVGALNASRLVGFRERFKHMEEATLKNEESILGEEPFLYGTHYSCPGYTLFWLVRVAPAHMLRLQNGRFDSPDRLFTSLAEAWDSVLTNPTDVKELIPEFFIPGMESILVNAKRLALGKRQDGRPVGDVTLPPWAHGSPKRFIELHRSALESPIVSANLHHWIDLVFGHKQRGEAAIGADNVFRSLTYEGVVDIDSIDDPVERLATEMAINEFGQCPRQIFHHPHPPRMSQGTAGQERLQESSPMLGNKLKRKADLTAIIISTIMAATEPSQGLVSPMGLRHFPPLDSAEMPVKTKTVDEEKKSPNTPFKTNLFSDCEPFKSLADFLPRLRAKHTWTPKSFSSLQTAGLATTSNAINAVATGVDDANPVWRAYAVDHDGHLRVYELERREMEGGNVKESKVDKLDGLHSPRSPHIAQQPLSSICVVDNVFQSHQTTTAGERYYSEVVLCGSYDGHVYVYNARKGQQLGRFSAHDDAVSCMTVVSIDAGHLGREHYVITASWDRTCKVWLLNGVGQEETADNPLWEIDRPAPMHILELQGGAWSLSAGVISKLSEACQDPRHLVIVIVVGTEDGEVVGAEFVPMGHHGTRKGLCEAANLLLLPRWNLALSDDYVGGVAVVGLNSEKECAAKEQSGFQKSIGDEYRVVAALADGRLMLIDPAMKVSGPGCLSSISCGTPLRCCVADQTLVFAGSESGEIVVWDVAQQLGFGSVLASTPFAPDIRGMHAPLVLGTGCPINSIAVRISKQRSTMCLVAGDERGGFHAWGAHEQSMTGEEDE